MTMSQLVVRRFDVQVEEPRLLAHVRDLLRAPETSPETKQVGAILLEVRLAGSVTAVSDVVSAVAGTHGVRIHHDRVRLAQTAQDKSLRPDSVYPDPRTLLSIGLKPGPPPTTPPGEPTVVAVVDSGMMVTHPDLKGRLWKGAAKGRPWEYGARCIGGGDESPDVTDQDGHGTRLAGTILTAAAGVQDIQLMAVKFFDADALPAPANGAAAIEFATKAEPKAHIINLSWDLALGSSDLERAIQEACEAGALVVIAAGNSGTDNDLTPTIPAHYRKVCPKQIITVMATDRSNEKASFSNYGATTVDLAAPGVDIVTTRASALGASDFFRRYRSYNGTSAAAALVTGAAARLKSRDPSLTADRLKDRLCESVREMPSLKSKCITGGLLDIGAAEAGKRNAQSGSPAWRR
jgi:subtilisin family serine protease